MLKQSYLSHFFAAFLLFAAPFSQLIAATDSGAWVEGKANYYEVKPPITVNLQAATIRYIQVKIQLMSREVHTLEKIEANKPAILDTLITLITAQDLATMQNVTTREKVRTEALKRIQELLKNIAGIVPGEVIGKGEDAKTIRGVEALYFTDFVVQ